MPGTIVDDGDMSVNISERGGVGKQRDNKYENQQSIF